MKTITKILEVINIKQLIDSPEHKALIEYLKNKPRSSTNISIKELRKLKLISPVNQQYLERVILRTKCAQITKVYIHSYYLKKVVAPIGTAYLIMIRFKFFKPNDAGYFTFSPFPKNIFPCIKYRITEVLNVLKYGIYSNQNNGTVSYHNRDFDEIELEDITARMLNAYTTDKGHTREGLKHNLITEAYYKYYHAGSIFKRYLSNNSTQELMLT